MLGDTSYYRDTKIQISIIGLIILTLFECVNIIILTIKRDLYDTCSSPWIFILVCTIARLLDIILILGIMKYNKEEFVQNYLELIFLEILKFLILGALSFGFILGQFKCEQFNNSENGFFTVILYINYIYNISVFCMFGIVILGKMCANLFR